MKDSGNGAFKARIALRCQKPLDATAYERPDHTLQPTALVHEAYLSLVGQDRAKWQNRAQFMAIAAQVMRRILLEHARRRKAAKRVARRHYKFVDSR